MASSLFSQRPNVKSLGGVVKVTSGILFYSCVVVAGRIGLSCTECISPNRVAIDCLEST